MMNFKILNRESSLRKLNACYSSKFDILQAFSSFVESDSQSSPTVPSTISERGPFVSRLKTRGVIRFDGPDVLNFLQGIVSNDMNKFEEMPSSIPIPGKSVPTPNQPAIAYPPLYASLLNPQGRFLQDIFFYRLPQTFEKLNKYGEGPNATDSESVSLFADVDSSSIDETLSILLKHRLRAKVDFENVSEETAVWVRFGGDLAQNSDSGSENEAGGMGYGGSEEIPAKSSAEILNGGWRWHKDPRIGHLGLRGIFPEDSTPPLVEAKEEIGEEYFKLWRYELGVAEGPTEIPKGDAIPLEYNLDGLNGISFEKGCYIGQELTARTHFRGVIRKRVLPIQFVSENGNEVERGGAPGSEITDESSGKVLGKVVASLGSRGLALLRLESGLREKARLKINGLDHVYVHSYRPNWWPKDWGTEVLVPNLHNAVN